MKNVYLVQASNTYGEGVKSVYLPYAAGCLAAYAWDDETIRRNYDLKRIIFTRENIADAVDSLEDPFFVGFSCYVWNYEYNKALAAQIKKKYPETVICFGGHNVAPDFTAFDECPAIDILCYREGEESFRELLLHLLDGRALDDIDNISFKRDGEYVQTAFSRHCLKDFPSPYLTGVFDDILKENYNFSALVETNRGCPNNCAYCDWGSLNMRVRLFPIERVKAEFDWISEHKIEYIFCCDANFGLFDRDNEIADYIINLKVTTGYPKVFRVCFTKNRTDFVKMIGRKFNIYGLDKAQTLSFQSMSQPVLDNINRKNIPVENFKKLMRLYNKDKVATFSELILGLPGETRESFVEGLCSLIECGQHDSIFVYPCELLPNSQMGSPEYIEKFGIKSIKTPFDAVHVDNSAESHEIKEYSRFIIETDTLSVDDWVYCIVYSTMIQALHNMGLLRCVAVYTVNETGISYKDFYDAFVRFSQDENNRVCSGIFNLIRDYSRGVTDNSNPWVVPCEPFGKISWRFEEVYFLKCILEIDGFYEEIGRFLNSFNLDGEIKAALLRYQYDIVKKPSESGEKEIVSDYDFYDYFQNIYIDEYKPLEKVKTKLTAHDKWDVKDLFEYSKEIVWYGRNYARSLLSSSCYSPEVKRNTEV
jgi:putative methyltransferase